MEFIFKVPLYMKYMFFLIFICKVIEANDESVCVLGEELYPVFQLFTDSGIFCSYGLFPSPRSFRTNVAIFMRMS